jgi:hypothetical protein
VHQFEEHYQATSFPLEGGIHLRNAFYLLDLWKSEAHDQSHTDYTSCQEALELISTLQLEGRIYYVDKEPVGFILGEFLNKEVFALHFSKANKHFKGSYQYMLQQFAKDLDDTCLYLNFEQDLGIPDLKKSKSSYLPDLMVKKGRVFLRHLI